MTGNTLALDLQRCLEKFMTETAARVVLKSTLESLRQSAEGLTTRTLPQVVAALSTSARHFVTPADRPKLENELSLLAKPGGGTPAPAGAPAAAARGEKMLLEIRSEADASRARTQASRLCQAMGGNAFHCQKIATGVSELARNQLNYAGGGKLEISAELTPKRLIRALATDLGTGIPNLEHILSGAYKSKTGMGLGLLGTKRLADRFDIQTSPTGTTVEFEVWL